MSQITTFSDFKLSDLHFDPDDYSPAFADLVFITTNEKDQFDIQQKIKEIPEIGELYIGVSGLYNFNIASLRSIKYILIFDFNPRVEYFYQHVVEIIKENDSRLKCLEKIKTFILENKENLFNPEGVKIGLHQDIRYYTAQVISKLQIEVNQNLSFLSSDERYEKIRNIILKGNFLFAKVNFREMDHFNDYLTEKLRKHKIAVDTFYLSNVGYYEDDLKDTFFQYIQPAIFIYSVIKNSYRDKFVLRQKIVRVKDEIERHFPKKTLIKKIAV